MSELVVEVSGLTKRFGPLTAVDGLSLEVPAGSIFGLLGPNGAGKTTSFSMLLGYQRPDAGGGTVLGAALWDTAGRKGRIGALPQDAELPPTGRVGTVLAYYARLQGIPGAKARDEARRVLELFELGDRFDARIRTLSHGMRKRVAMAQAFIGSPELVFLDEPTAGLDPRLAREVRDYIRSNAGGRTIVVSSHNLNEIQEICDAVAILSRGKLVKQGAMGEITGSGNEVVYTVEGEVPAVALVSLEARGWKVKYEPDRKRVRVEVPGDQPVEKAMSEGMALLVENGVMVGGVAKGRSLEERFLEMT